MLVCVCLCICVLRLVCLCVCARARVHMRVRGHMSYLRHVWMFLLLFRIHPAMGDDWSPLAQVGTRQATTHVHILYSIAMICATCPGGLPEPSMPVPSRAWPSSAAGGLWINGVYAGSLHRHCAVTASPNRNVNGNVTAMSPEFRRNVTAEM